MRKTKLFEREWEMYMRDWIYPDFDDLSSSSSVKEKALEDRKKAEKVLKRKRFMGKFSRDKGARFEREVANRLKPIFGESVKRSAQAWGGKYVSDVEGTPFWVECKVGKKTYPKKALEQAIHDMGEEKGKIPIAVCKDDRQAPLVTMLLEDFLDLVQEWYERGSKV